MLEYVFRFSVDRGKQNEFVDWLKANEADLKNHTRPGWSYLGTWMTVGDFGDYSGEARYELDDYASLGEGWGDETAQRLLSEFSAYIDNVHREVSLLKNIETVSVAPDT